MQRMWLVSRARVIGAHLYVGNPRASLLDRSGNSLDRSMGG
jgi:hypothetical protein